MSAATRDLVHAAGYLAAVGAIVAASTLGCGLLVRAMPGILTTWMPPAETTGSGASADAAYVPWRLSPQDAQRRFAARSSVLLPPTPAFAVPENGWPSQVAVARARALETSARSGAAPRLPEAVNAPTAANPAVPVANVDFQAGGR